MSDTNHTWNDGKPIRSRKQSCGCHVTAEIFELCERGRDLKKSADSCYGLYMHNKNLEVDGAIVKAMCINFEIHRDGYLTHLKTGKDWVL